MRWEVSETGKSLKAFSSQHDDGTPFEYEVIESEVGGAVLTGTSELFPPEFEGAKTFNSVMAAIAWAEQQECHDNPAAARRSIALVKITTKRGDTFYSRPETFIPLESAAQIATQERVFLTPYEYMGIAETKEARAFFRVGPGAPR